MQSSWSLPPEQLGLQAWATGGRHKFNFQNHQVFALKFKRSWNDYPEILQKACYNQDILLAKIEFVLTFPQEIKVILLIDAMPFFYNTKSVLIHICVLDYTKNFYDSKDSLIFPRQNYKSNILIYKIIWNINLSEMSDLNEIKLIGKPFLCRKL
jgi:hypothetical protein